VRRLPRGMLRHLTLSVTLALVFTILFPVPPAAYTESAPANPVSAMVHYREGLDRSHLGSTPGVTVLVDYSSFAVVEASPSALQRLREAGAGVELLEDRTMIHVGDQSFSTRGDQPPLPDWLEEDIQAGEASYFLVQFKGPIKEEWKGRLTGAGARVEGYVPNFTLIVKATPETIEGVRTWPVVQWAGPYHRGYRLPADLKARLTAAQGGGESDGEGRYIVEFFAGEKTAHLVQLLAAAGGQAADVVTLPMRDGGTETRVRLIVEGGLSALLPLVNEGTFSWMAPALDIQLFNAEAREIVRTGQVHHHGLTGKGQVVAVTDSGLDYNHEMFADETSSEGGWNIPGLPELPDIPGLPLPGPGGPGFGPEHRKIEAYLDMGGASFLDREPDSVGHGTHVGGTIAGDAPPYGEYNKNDGQAYEARLVIAKVFNSLGMWGAGSDFFGAWEKIHDAGAAINNNSWGGKAGGAYNVTSADADRFLSHYRNDLLVVAAGNFGEDGAGSIAAPASAKNVLTVGAAVTATPEDIAFFSSRGPTKDGRAKPDVCAPGSYITSAEKGTADGYIDYQGTSMATPTTSGAVALARQYFTDGYYPSGQKRPGDGFVPSGALLKAVMINGAREMTGELSDANGEGAYPNMSQGWGRIDLNRSLYFAGDARVVKVWDNPARLTTGQVWEADLRVEDPGQDLRVHLVWTDTPAEESAGRTLVNDLDLEVIAPDGTVYPGNNLVSRRPGRSVPGEHRDHLNTVEGVCLVPGQATSSGMPTGSYRMRVTAGNIPDGPQDFALVASGGLGGGQSPAPEEPVVPPEEPVVPPEEPVLPPEEPVVPPEEGPQEDSVAVIGDHPGQMRDLLEEEGFTVESFEAGMMKDVADNISRYRAVVVGLTGEGDDIAGLAQAASESGTGLVFTGAYPPSRSGIGAYSRSNNSPETVKGFYGRRPVAVRVLVEHPILAGYTPGDQITLVDGDDNDFVSFSGFDGQLLAEVGDGDEPSGLLAVHEEDSRSRTVLLGLVASEYTDTSAWTPDGRELFSRAVRWAAGD